MGESDREGDGKTNSNIYQCCGTDGEKWERTGQYFDDGNAEEDNGTL